MRHIWKIMSSKGIEKNFKFMVLEVTKQVEDTAKVLENPGPKIIDKIYARDDYIDNLKTVIENECFYSNFNREPDKKTMDVIRSVDIIANNLEKIADYAENIVSQTSYLKNPAFIKKFGYNDFFWEALQGLGLINEALLKMDISLALRICRVEFNLDKLFATNFKKIMGELQKGEEAENLVTTLLILGYLERMGDALLNIGEAVIFAAVGERLKIHDFEALEDSIKSFGLNGSLEEVTIKSILETKSGCKIKHLRQKKEEQGKKREVIFKEGRIKKIRKERENIELWETISPGLPPKVFEYQEKGNKAFLLEEFLDGVTLQQIMLEPWEKTPKETISSLKNTLVEIWTRTKKDQRVRSGFIRQLKARVDDIFKVHPEFKKPSERIGPLKAPSFTELLDKAEEIESNIWAPFSVMIHGDFNIDNIFFSRNEKRIRYVDFYRSKQQDYVQDISVFLVSNFRLPVFDSLTREKLNYAMTSIYKFAKEFSREQGDETFDARLALGLARSFTTSTRFEFNRKFAADMYHRGVFLLRKVLEHKDCVWSNFKLPEEILIY